MSTISKSPKPPAGLPIPVTPQNQWGCAVAALSFGLHRAGYPLGQTEMIVTIGLNYPKWQFCEGIMSVGDMISALDHIGIPCRRFIRTDDKNEVLAYYRKHKREYLMGFIITTKPTNHCQGVGEITKNGLWYNNGARPSSSIQFKTWRQLKRDHNPQYVLLFKGYRASPIL